ncbi:MAG: hypothetical protein ACRD0J_06910, partial [Acidimicrobiales bacterium]
ARRATRGRWGTMAPPARLALAGSGAVAAAVIGAVAWAGVVHSQSRVYQLNPSSLVGVTQQLHLASAKYDLATSALSKGDYTGARQALAAAQVATSKAVSQLPSVVQPAPSTDHAGDLAAQDAKYQEEIAGLKSEINKLSAAVANTTTSTPATTPTTAPPTSASSTTTTPTTAPSSTAPTTVPPSSSTSAPKPPPTTAPPETAPPTSTTLPTTTSTKPPPTTEPGSTTTSPPGGSTTTTSKGTTSTTAKGSTTTVTTLTRITLSGPTVRNP